MNIHYREWGAMEYSEWRRGMGERKILYVVAS